MVNENYARLAGAISTVCNCLDMGLSLGELYELCENNFRGVYNTERYPGNPRTVKEFIEKLKNAFDSLMNSSSDEKIIRDKLEEIIKKYNLADANQLVNLINEFMIENDIITQLINNINTAYKCQRVNVNSLSTFVSELVNNMANYTAMQNNSSQMFINLNNTLNENAILKTENEQLKRQLANINMNNFGQTY